MKTILASLVAFIAIAGIGITAVNALDSQALTSDAAPRGDVQWTPATNVDVPSDVITLDPVVITANRPAKPHAVRVARQTGECGAFQFRGQAQGPVTQQVRGFCGAGY